MTVRTQTISDFEDKNSLTPTGSHSRAKTVVYVGEVGKGHNFLHREGLNRLGRAITIPDFTKEVNEEMINAGAVKGHQYTIPLESTRNMEFGFDQFKLVAMWLSKGSDVAPVYNYASDGQTTISDATRKSGTVASATGLAKNDLVVVDTKHATYGGFLEATIIRSINGTAVEFDPPLDHVPSNGATFKKIKNSSASGATESNTGIIFPDTVDIEYPRVSLVVDEYFPSSNQKFVRYFPEVEVLPGTDSASGNMKILTIRFRAIQQTEESFTLIDGSTRNTPWYGKGIWLPQ
jgi:hypothetical protein